MKTAFLTILIVGALGFLSLSVVGQGAMVPLTVLLALGIAFNLLIEFLSRRRIAPLFVDWAIRLGNLALITAGVHFSWGPRSPFLPLYHAFVIVASLRRGRAGAKQGFALTLIALGVLGILTWPLTDEEALRLVVNGSIAGAVALGAGMTGQRHLDARREAERRSRELSALLSELERIGQQRTEFIQNAAHDLRNPLTFVQSYAELLTDGSLGPLTPEQRKAAEIIAAKTQSLDTLIDDIALLQTGETDTLEPTQLDLVQVTRELLEAATAVAQRRRVTLHLETKALALPVQADRTALEQIIDNLLSNAIKYSLDGGDVTLRLSRLDSQAHLAVRDQGIGLAPEEQRQLFARFYRAPTARRLNIPGTGLGLAIVKQLVTAHGGHVWVESEPDRGSTFHVTFPLAEETNTPLNGKSKRRSPLPSI